MVKCRWTPLNSTARGSPKSRRLLSVPHCFRKPVRSLVLYSSAFPPPQRLRLSRLVSSLPLPYSPTTIMSTGRFLYPAPPNLAVSAQGQVVSSQRDSVHHHQPNPGAVPPDVRGAEGRD